MKKLLLATATSVFLAGCAAWFPETKADREPHYPTVADLQSRLVALEQQAAREASFKSDQPWLVKQEVKEYPRYPYLDDQQITISQFGKTLPEMVGRLAEQLNVNIHLAADLYMDKGEDSRRSDAERMDNRSSRTGQPASIEQPKIVDTASVMTLFGGAFGGDGERFGNPLKTRISVVSQGGSASALLDNIAAQLGISWRYDETRNQVTFYRLAQETFQVFFPGVADAAVELGRSGDRDAVIRQQASFENESGSWDEIAEGVQALLSPLGKATLVKGTGSLVVIDTPEILESVSEYVKSINDIYGRQVYLQIRTASATVESTNDFNITWNNILNTVNNGQFQIGTNSAEVATQALPNVFNVIRTSTGANLALELLATEFESTEINEQAVTTLSNQPTSLKVLTETGYISGISQQDSTTSSDNVVSDVQTDTVNIGFDATLVPRVVSDSRLQLQVALELSSNLTLVNFDSTIVQTPTRDRNSVVQRAWLRNGETWVIAAFSSEKQSNQESGTGSAKLWGLGGGTSKSKSKQVLLVMITPHIQDGVF
ncbi:type II secretory pathway protein [Marinobacter lutaoensis]|uniref:Type II secretory pathway protein n=1 Tax=Marinobacter lutaoensis TaxID=135739 RepID=A0A1V2DPP3_9GAMM|nr:type II secretory pathway protein [Marinobacter lutaoensis]ONF42604.1 type II secretory pathway protein [Marinobacter lutaoensis]